MTQPEGRIVRKIKDVLKARGHYVIKHHGGEYGAGGVPDLLVCVSGRFVGLEVKRPDTRDHLSPQQRYNHEKIRKAGGFVSVVCSQAEALEFVRRVEKLGLCGSCGRVTIISCGDCDLTGS